MEQKKKTGKSLATHGKSAAAASAKKGQPKGGRPQLEVRFASRSAEARKLQCEVIAVAPDLNSEETPRFNLHSDFQEYTQVAERLVLAHELAPASAGGCLVRFGGLRGGEHLLIVGTGKDKEGINALGATERMRRLGATVFQRLRGEKIKEAVIYLDSFLAPASDLVLDAKEAAYAFFEGMGLAAYEFKQYFSKKSPAKKSNAADDSDNDEFTVIVGSSDEARAAAYAEGLKESEILVEAATLCRDLGNEPSNVLFPAEFADRARKVASGVKARCVVLDEKAMAREKMGLLVGVGQGSIKPPRLVVLEYVPPARKGAPKPRTIAFVGKGVTFDSGGISIKPSARMEEMKLDMCGAAAVLGAFQAVARLGLNVHLYAVIAAAENMPGGRAIQPGNILSSRAGKLVEVTNTDAEGRLVLADALDYIQDKKPEFVIDLATLTGAVTITLGKACSGLMANDEGFAGMIEGAAARSGERVWELPLFDEYFDDLKSEYADMRNSGDSPSHGTAKGAMFLKQFIRKGTKWAHLDIAAVSYGMGGIPYCPKKAASGYGVRLLVELARGLQG